MTTRECVHLVMRVYFRSRDKNGDHTIPPAIVENHMLHANFVVLCFIKRELMYCRSKFYIAGIGTVDLFGSCDLDLDPMTFIYEPDS